MATTKFEDVEKLVSPREPPSTNETLKKATEPVSILETQKASNKSKTEDK